jgi:drug/metabolite transporter (DMT)-like permease
MILSWLWIPATLAAAAGQTARNIMQRKLIESIGTVGATQVRFLYGFPFALAFLLANAVLVPSGIPAPTADFLGFLSLGAVAQIAATALMLAAMRQRSFSVVTAIIKTEPVQVALFGLLFLGDPLTPAMGLAIAIATAGVLLVSVGPQLDDLTGAGLTPVALGAGAGSLFALAAIGFRGAVISLDPAASFVTRATTTLAWGLGLQTLLLVAWLGLFDRAALLGSLRAWRSSLSAGFLGALASELWFTAFALTAAANVRTLALVEVPMAYLVSRRLLAQRASGREIVGMTLIVLGVILLLVSQAG